MPNYRQSGSRLIYLIFFLSGVSALVYEVIWMKHLTLIMGNTVHSSTTVLASFMAGLAIGSLVFGRVVDRSSISPLKLYAYLELGIGFFAFVFPLLIRGFQDSYVALHHLLGLNLTIFTITRFMVSFTLLLIPTILMGATLPVLSKYVEEGYVTIGERIGHLYAINTLGAVMGVLATGYVLLGLSGINATTRSAILINLLVVLLAFLQANRDRQKGGIEESVYAARQSGTTPPLTDRAVSVSLNWIALVTYFLSGFLALGYEILWMRVFIPFLQSSTYSFTTMLAAFLTGLSIGSWIFSQFVDRRRSLMEILGWMQLSIGCLTLFSILSFLSYYRLFSSYLDLRLEQMNAFSFLITFLYFFIILLPPCILMGGIFPVIIKMVSKGDIRHIGTKVGNIYFANTTGGILGSVLTGFIFIPLVGVHSSLIVFMITNILLGILLLFLNPARKERRVAMALGGVFIGGLIIGIALWRGNVFVSVLKEHLNNRIGENDLIYYKEGATATVSVAEARRSKARYLLINSIAITVKSLETRLMAHLPLLLHPNPRKALVICLGMGTTFRSLGMHGVEVTGVELVPEEIETMRFFQKDAPQILQDPRFRIEINDGRNYLELTQEKYDVITVDPSPPLYSSGMVNLYTPEFYRLCRDRLTPRGVLSMWFYLRSCHTSEFQMMMKSFLSVFPNATIWRGPGNYGVYAIGTKETLQIDRNLVRQRIQKHPIQNDLRESYPGSLKFDEDFIFDLFLFNSARIWNMVKDGPLLSDDTPYIEHPLITWWLDPTKLDTKRLFSMEKDDVSEYLSPSRHGTGSGKE